MMSYNQRLYGQFKLFGRLQKLKITYLSNTQCTRDIGMKQVYNVDKIKQIKMFF